ncbi:MAG: glycine zipper 2TM domain-containing protein [Pseudomonadota bacterium]
MMSARVRRTGAAVMVPIWLAACAQLPPEGTPLTPQQREEAQKTCIAQYTAMGAIGGALLGMLVSSKNDRTQGALIGAAAGGAIAYSIAWGKCLRYYSDVNSFPVADARQTAAAIGYKPAKGELVKVQSFTVHPAKLRPGETLNLQASYYVMAPEGTRDVKVVETRTVHFYDPEAKAWKELGSEQTPLTAALGTRRSDGKVGMPPEVAEGRYRVTFKVSALGRSDETSQEILISKS